MLAKTDRRKMLGSLLVGTGSVLTGCQMPRLGAHVADRGRLLLDRIPNLPAGLRNAVRFPLVEALHGRRARRFSRGSSIPEGPFAYTSPHPPMPLGELEQMMVLTAAAGNTDPRQAHGALARTQTLNTKNTEKRQMVPTSRLTALRNGVTLPYVAQGDPSGVPVVLLHGYTDSWRSFEGVLGHLPRSIRAYAVTMRGHGDADRPESGYHPDDFVADVEAFMDAVGIESAVLVGHCMGAMIARRFAARHPERVLGLVLASSFATLGDKPGIAELCEGVAELADPVDRDFAREFQASCIARPVPDGLLDTVVGESVKMPARVWRAVLGGIVDADGTEQLDRIAAPTLLAWGDADALVPREDQEALLAAIPGAELAVYRGGGHSLHWEEPAEFAADLSAFVQSVAERAIVGR